VSHFRVIIQPRARAEAMEGFRWITERSPTAAARWYAGLRKAVAKLAENPEINPLAEEESEHFGITIRQALYGRRRGVYRILYSIQQDTISVIAIRHSARGPIED
jgi:plasmid stabilization system protein ParE